jgi:hypothetical protein
MRANAGHRGRIIAATFGDAVEARIESWERTLRARGGRMTMIRTACVRDGRRF